MQEIKSFFREKFGSPPTYIVKAPGRLELLGNHTDYNEGLVMSIAIDKYIYIASAPRKDGQVELVSTSFPERETFFVDRIEKNPVAPWSNYSKGVLLQLRERGVHFTGFNAAIHGTIPFGAGLSSSAALEIATALTVRDLFPFSLNEISMQPAPVRDSRGHLPTMKNNEKMALAKVGQAAERKFVGANVGLLDQISSLFGKQNQVIEIDCRTNTVHHAPMPAGIAVVICDSEVKHDLSDGAYNELREHCESAARALGVKALRSVTMDELRANKAKLSDREYQCAYHIVGENQRVVAGERALREKDIAQFGQYLFQSHESSRDYFGNSTKELDLLVEIARQQRNCYGARLSGGGFGGATINLVEHTEVPAFQAAISEGYLEGTGKRIHPWVGQVVDGAA
jgi:galactokinase